jgi:hypothetical protein
MLTLKGPIDSLVNRVVTRVVRAATPTPVPAKISFAGTRMERAEPWITAPTEEQFAAVAGSPGPFPELRDKDL